jgi:hypothetical protein
LAAGGTRANLERANAQIADQQAKSEMDAGAYNANLIRQRGAKVAGQQVASIGANNLQQGGTPSQVVGDTARATELSALTENNNALRRAWGFQVQGASDRTQADLAEQGGILSGIGTLAGTAGSLYKMSANS